MKATRRPSLKYVLRMRRTKVRILSVGTAPGRKRRGGSRGYVGRRERGWVSPPLANCPRTPWAPGIRGGHMRWGKPRHWRQEPDKRGEHKEGRTKRGSLIAGAPTENTRDQWGRRPQREGSTPREMGVAPPTWGVGLDPLSDGPCVPGRPSHCRPVGPRRRRGGPRRSRGGAAAGTPGTTPGTAAGVSVLGTRSISLGGGGEGVEVRDPSDGGGEDDQTDKRSRQGGPRLNRGSGGDGMGAEGEWRSQLPSQG